MTPADSPTIVVIAGPNGAGKSTTAPRLLKGALAVSEFVNADTIAQGLSAFRPESVAIPMLATVGPRDQWRSRWTTKEASTALEALLHRRVERAQEPMCEVLASRSRVERQALRHHRWPAGRRLLGCLHPDFGPSR